MENNNKVTFVVFWLEGGQPCMKDFAHAIFEPASAFCESLRKRAREGAPISHITISSDQPGNVTLAGVSDKLPAGYDWTKRRTTAKPGRERREMETVEKTTPLHEQ